MTARENELRGAYAMHDTTPGQARADLVEVKAYLAKNPKATHYDIELCCHMGRRHVDCVLKRMKNESIDPKMDDVILEMLKQNPRRRI